MADNERLVEFELLGQKFKFYTAATEEEMRSILALVKPLLETDPGKSTGTLPVGKIAILASLNIASRYVKLQQEFDNYRRDSEEKHMQLSEQIRSGLLKE